jgi:hypothetical protein|tara:strand:- start:828 stop:1064 length:237 start_codon:yes stop_codon:yes gene_type:complete
MENIYETKLTTESGLIYQGYGLTENESVDTVLEMVKDKNLSQSQIKKMVTRTIGLDLEKINMDLNNAINDNNFLQEVR